MILWFVLNDSVGETGLLARKNHRGLLLVASPVRIGYVIKWRECWFAGAGAGCQARKSSPPMSMLSLVSSEASISASAV